MTGSQLLIHLTKDVHLEEPVELRNFLNLFLVRIMELEEMLECKQDIIIKNEGDDE